MMYRPDDTPDDCHSRVDEPESVATRAVDSLAAWGKQWKAWAEHLEAKIEEADARISELTEERDDLEEKLAEHSEE